jgi:4-hydroxythreonine-4-phosphate dehydrogenase
MPRVLILADDLSGAADCGIACVNAGLEALVSLGPPSPRLIVDVISVDADSRCLDASAAAERMGQLMQVHAKDPTMLIFKKIDSTLRGHLGPELAAVLEARRAVVKGTVAVMAPAFPANGRTTVGGMHYVHGRPLHETEMWKNDRMTGEAYIPQMLEGSGLRNAHLDLATVRSSRAAFNAAVSNASEIADVLVCDAVTDEDLRSIAEAAIDLEGRAVWVGSAGLAQQLPKAAGLTMTNKDTVTDLPQTSGPVLFVIGSASRTTRQQATTLLSSSDIHGVVVPPEVLLAGPEGPDWDAFTMELYDAVEKREDVILLCGSQPEVDVVDRPKLSQALGEMTAALRGRVGAVVASGGETARMVLDRWGVRTLRLHGELERGVPVSSTVVDGTRPLTVITKAGDFGQPYTLLHCQEWLSKRGVFK